MIPPRDSNISRVESFSDAMLAFAATLLVVSLDTPGSYDELVTSLYGFFPFAVSFAALFLIWLVHRSLFRRYPLHDTASVLINGALLFVVLFFVHPVRFLAASFASLYSRSGPSGDTLGHVQNLFMVSAIGWIVVFALFAILYRRAWQTRDALSLTPVEAYDATTSSRHYVGFVLAGVLSLVIAWLGAGISWGLPAIALAASGAFSTWNSRARRKGRDELAAQVAEHPQLAYTGSMRTDEIQQLIK